MVHYYYLVFRLSRFRILNFISYEARQTIKHDQEICRTNMEYQKLDQFEVGEQLLDYLYNQINASDRYPFEDNSTAKIFSTHTPTYF
jgi:hypothetical protein